MGKIRFYAVCAVMAVVMFAAVRIIRQRDVVRSFADPVTSPAYFDDYYADPATRPADLLAADRAAPRTYHAR